MKSLVIIPAYNEEKSILNTVADIKKMRLILITSLSTTVRRIRRCSFVKMQGSL